MDTSNIRDMFNKFIEYNAYDGLDKDYFIWLCGYDPMNPESVKAKYSEFRNGLEKAISEGDFWDEEAYNEEIEKIRDRCTHKIINKYDHELMPNVIEICDSCGYVCN